MKVTTELKNLIKRSFDEKRANVQREAKEEATKVYEDVVKEVETSKEFKALVKAGNAFREKFDDKFRQTKSYDSDSAQWYTGNQYDNLKDIKARSLILDNVGSFIRYNDDIGAKTREKTKELDLAQESLMIKLTYEKDIESIREMLAEYGITI